MLSLSQKVAINIATSCYDPGKANNLAVDN
jgi:hypothetical protein